MTARDLREKIAARRGGFYNPAHNPAPAPPVEDGECWAPDETDDGLRGGQGRTTRDLDAATGILVGFGLMIGLAVVAGVAFWALHQIAVAR